MKRGFIFYSCLILFAIPTYSLASITKDIRITNVTDSGFAISWITSVKESGHINFGLSKSLGNTAYDNRGQVDTHYIDVSGLTPNTTYYYEIVSGGTVNNNNGAYYIIKTGSSLVYSGSNLAYGRVLKEDKKTPAEGALVYLKIKDDNNQGSPGESSLASCLVDSNGYWSIELVNLRTQSFQELFEHSSTVDKLIIFANGGSNGQGDLTIDIGTSSPAQTIILSTDTVPPSAINDLTVKTIMTTQITITWTAPGDDGMNGLATAYDIRYSTSTINDSNWAKATIVKNPPNPQQGGQKQEFTVVNLLPNTTYYLAIKTSDDRFWSALSNIVQFTTKSKECPVLDWVGLPNYLKDGLNIEKGTTGINFIYLVKYTDQNNELPAKGEPKIILFKEDIPLGSFSLEYVNGTPSTGMIYTYSKVFPDTGNYSYKFYADKSIGEPTNLTNGPQIEAVDSVVKTTNLTDSQFTVSWETKNQEKGYVRYGTNTSALSLVAYDDRGENFIDDTHHITISGLKQNTTYYYNIISGGISQGTYTEQTGINFIPDIQKSDIVYGQVYLQGHLTPAIGAIVYLQIQDNDQQETPNRSAKGSVIVNEQGYWSYDLVNLRTINGQDSFSYSTTGDLVHLFAQGSNDGIASQIISTRDDFPAPDMELSIDHKSPAAIIDLLALTPGTSTFTLNWTSPGDDGIIGSATVYDIRYATFTITEESWGMASEAKMEPVPKLAGNKEKFILTGLIPDTTYYFAIKSWDEALNISELSNVVQTKTLPIINTPPVLEWAGITNYISDGVYPDKDNIDMEYTFMVKYRDDEADPPPLNEPKVLIYKEGELIGSWTMTNISGDYKTGAIYRYCRFFTITGTYTYRFFVGSGTGIPTQLTDGPIIIPIPYKETNITGSQFTVSWISKLPETGYIEYGKTSGLGTRRDDDRLTFTVDDTHHITVSDLQPNTRYYYDVISGGIRDNNNGSHYTILTGTEIVPVGSNIIYGTVYKQGRLEYGTGAIVYIQLIADLEKSAEGSTLVDNNGNWAMDLINFRDETLNAFFKYRPAQDDLSLFAQGAAQGTDTKMIKPIAGKPSPDMELSIDITPPAKITDLSATQTTMTSTTLNWSCSGDDNNRGTATSYVLRYSLSPITEMNWNNAISVTGIQHQTYTITGLNSATLYYFAIKSIDESGNISALSNIASTTTAAGTPTLRWLGISPYLNDGVNPDRGTVSDVFTYRIIYADPDFDAPNFGYPRLYIKRDGVLLFPNGQTMYRIAGNNFQNGVTYETTVRIATASDRYSYYFEAKDIHNVVAIGTPTTDQKGPIVAGINNKPTLSWTLEQGYISDGVEPNVGNQGGTFTFHVLYRDLDNDPPSQGYPKLKLLLDNKPVSAETLTFIEGSWTAGAIYSLSVKINQSGRYQYRFEASDNNGAVADGIATLLQIGPIVGTPISSTLLEWVNTSGVNPNSGTAARTLFTYRVRYSDPFGSPPATGYPKLFLLRGSNTIYFRGLTLIKESGNDFKQGVIYSLKLRLPIASDYYSYYFKAINKQGTEAIGAPTMLNYGPIVVGMNLAPTLSYSKEIGFKFDGIEPNIGTINTAFTYQVGYKDLNSDPPCAGFPLLYIYKDNQEFATKTMSYLKGTYAVRAVFIATITLTQSGSYKYKIIANDNKGLSATGPITTLQNGPLVNNPQSKPILSWAGLTNYEDTGVAPLNGSTFIIYIYKVKYTDPNASAPKQGFPKLFVFKGGIPFNTTGFIMSKKLGHDFAAGVIYTYKLILTIASNDYTYRFESQNPQGDLAIGTPTIIQKGPTVLGKNINPILSWTRKTGYISDGIEPHTGTPGTIFSYQISYKDFNSDQPANDYPCVYLYKDSVFIGSRTMKYMEGSFATGAIYIKTETLTEIGQYSYRFEAKDSYNAIAIGQPIFLKNGPTIGGQPILKWTGEAGYVTDGIEPQIGTEGTVFIFRVNYQDLDNDPPANGEPKLFIFSASRGTMSFVMNQVDTQDILYTNGKTYTYSVVLSKGSYSYTFAARDIKGLEAIGLATVVSMGPLVNDLPVLEWVKEQGYQSDGIEPAIGSVTTKFIYKVIYKDSDPPATFYPKLHILKGGEEINGSPFIMNEVNANDKNYEDGKTYSYGKILQITGNDYSYLFEARDINNISATGEPTGTKTGPLVSDSPVLEWADITGYKTDGLEPGTGTSRTMFAYIIKYIDINNDQPSLGFPNVHIYKGEQIIGSFSMSLMNSGKASNGILYRFAKNGFFAGFDYKYRFEAKDINGLDAIGSPTSFVNGPQVNNPPELFWTGEVGYISDGINPQGGTTKATFTYRVKYVDADNHPPVTGYPRVHISNENGTISISPQIMQPVDTSDINYQDGKIYTLSITLPLGTYTYYFEAKDTYQGIATGLPTIIQKGPIVDNAPALFWVEKDGYRNDGVFPDISTTTTTFIFKVGYIDGNNLPPSSGYPKIFIAKSGSLLNPAGYSMVKVSTGDFDQGVIYQYIIRFPFSSEYYTYYFSANNSQQIPAKGEPTNSKSGPIVTGINFRPLLAFTGEQGYQFGVKPYVDKPETIFTFHVKYSDHNGDPPSSGYPLLLLYKDGKKKGSYSAVYSSGQISTGAIYSVSIPLSELGNYQYRFEAKDNKGAIAYGVPTLLINAPIVNRYPLLEWAGGADYISDGLEPDVGTPGTIFTYKIKYKDPDNNPLSAYYPKVYIFKDGKLLPKFPYGVVMGREVGTSAMAGLTYESSVMLSKLGNYTYCFAAKDKYGLNATGTPTIMTAGPTVVSVLSSPIVIPSYQEMKELIVNIFPNPSSGEINIRAKTNLMDVDVDMAVEIYNITGEDVWNKRQSVKVNSDGDVEISWNAKVASGIYIYRVTIEYEGKALSSIGKIGIVR